MCFLAQESKLASNRAKEKAAAAERMQRRLQSTRGEYHPIAKRTSCLYFTVASLAHVDPMYHFSLDWFVAAFRTCVHRCTAPKRAIGIRVRELVQSFTAALYASVSRALFSKVRLSLWSIMTLGGVV